MSGVSLSFGMVERLPVPSLRTYVVMSGTLMCAILYYAYTKAQNELWQSELQDRLNASTIINDNTKHTINESSVLQMFFYTFSDQLSIWVIVNFLCCVLTLFSQLLIWFVFGKLRLSENAALRERFWNMVFYKMIFLFGVLNVQYIDEMLFWISASVAFTFIFMLTILAQDRFKYSSTSPSVSDSQYRIVSLMLICAVCSLIFLLLSLLVCVKFGWNYGLFLAADSLQLLLRSVYCVSRYGTVLVDKKQSLNLESRQNFLYSCELIFELLILLVNLVHHVHMLIWSNIFLSVASLVICMQLRQIYHEIDVRVKRHRQYRKIVDHMDLNYPLTEDIPTDDLTCAICWDDMTNARRLPCGHLYHNWCLRGWLEQDTSCPTCRVGLAVNTQQSQQNEAQNRRRRRFNHFFHFDGGRYARWLPSFSVEVTHNLGAGNIFRRGPPLTDSQSNQAAQRIREMFPQIPHEVILEDLTETGSDQATIENILEGRITDQGYNDAASSSDDNFSADESDDTSQSDFDFDHDALPGPSSRPSEEVASASTSNDSSTTASRFSKSSSEREHILQDRKDHLIELHRRRYLEALTSEQSQSQSQLTNRHRTGPT